MDTRYRLKTIMFLLCSCLAMPVNSAVVDEKAATAACGEDLNKFCHDVTPGEGRIGLCLEEYRKELSSSCQQFIMATTQKLAREFLAACQNDVTQYCSQVQPGGGRVLQCLRENSQKITSTCANLVNKR